MARKPPHKKSLTPTQLFVKYKEEYSRRPCKPKPSAPPELSEKQLQQKLGKLVGYAPLQQKVIRALIGTSEQNALPAKEIRKAIGAKPASANQALWLLYYKKMITYREISVPGTSKWIRVYYLAPGFIERLRKALA